MKQIISLYLFITLFFVAPLAGQNFNFKKYKVEDGLSHNTVWCVIQDSYGFMWFGTSGGLNRFDGTEFRSYKNVGREIAALGNNQIYTLCEDEDTDIWMGTSRGVYVFARETKTFDRFDLQTEFGVVISSEVRKIVLSQSGKIWIATLGQGFFIYDPSEHTLEQNSGKASFVRDLSEGLFGDMYMSSRDEGLLCFDSKGRFISQEKTFMALEQGRNESVNCVENIDGDIWFGVGSSYLGCMDWRRKECEYFATPDIGVISAISKYSRNELLIGSDYGLYWFDTSTKLFEKIESRHDSRGLSDQTICAILQDREGGYWISTYFGGVNYLAKQTKRFEYYYPDYAQFESSGSFSGKVVNAFCETPQRGVWVGGKSGLRLLDSKTGKISNFEDYSWDVRDLLMDGDNLWIATFGEGIKVYDGKMKLIKDYLHVRNELTTICGNEVLSLYKDRKGTIYVGTSWGLCRYNRATDDFTTLNFVGTMMPVVDMMEEREGALWVATLNSGVFRYDSERNSWRSFSYETDKENSLGNNSVTTIFEDSNSVMWFGTDGGGLYYYGGDESFYNFDPEEKILPSRIIYSIEEDSLGYFWVSTSAGLIRINMRNKSDYNLFTWEDGLQGNQFNARASLNASDGKFYFGGIDGFNAFYPDQFKENEYVPPVYVTNVRFYDKKRNNASVDLTITFASLSYENSSRNRYCYMLEGMEQDWIFTSQNSVVYNKLSPGKYTFRVKGSNNDGVWNEEGASILIVVKPPWWGTNLAYFIYFLLSCVVIYAIVRYLRRRTNRKIEREIKEFDVRKEKEVFQSKIDFFVNLVHEIRTPLSLIRLPLGEITRINKDGKTGEYLTVVNRNIDYLQDIVDNLLEFQKMDSGKTELRYAKEDMNSLIGKICDLFSGIEKLGKIEFNLRLPDHSREYPVDADAITKIVVNLVSNSLKHTKSLINITAEYTDSWFAITVEDDGPGVLNTEKIKIFEPFYQTKTPYSKGVGIGLAFSRQLAELHNGTLVVGDNRFGGASFRLEIGEMKESLPVEIIESAIVDIAGNELYQNLDFKTCRVLVVEDNVELLDMISEILSESLIVVKARNGSEALDKLAVEVIDVVVSDVMMPQMDGFELVKAIKSDINISHIPVILLTAKVSREAKLEGMKQGADVYIEKPFSIEYLKMQIYNLLKLRLALQNFMVNMSHQNIVDMAVSNKDMEFLTKLQSEIEIHLSEADFSIDGIAEAMFMSRSNFYRKIKSITGMPPNDYLKTVRLNKAAELLKNEDVMIRDVYLQVGFNSSSYFARCFREHFDVSPKEYRDRIVSGEG